MSPSFRARDRERRLTRRGSPSRRFDECESSSSAARGFSAGTWSSPRSHSATTSPSSRAGRHPRRRGKTRRARRDTVDRASAVDSCVGPGIRGVHAVFLRSRACPRLAVPVVGRDCRRHGGVARNEGARQRVAQRPVRRQRTGASGVGLTRSARPPTFRHAIGFGASIAVLSSISHESAIGR